MERISVRPACVGDLEAMVALLAQLFALEPDFRFDPVRQRKGLALLLEDRLRRVAFVAELGGSVLGMVTGQLVVSTAEGGGSVLVEDMVVIDSERRRGVGRSLLRAVEAWARGRGATRLQLLADRENEAALRFYERLGWSGTRLVCLRRGGV
jgi:GNAT superfamily N-acetyltransferase